MITARYNSAIAKLTAVFCYAPTEDDEKVSFYESLQKIINNTSSHDVLLLYSSWETQMGKKRRAQ